MIATNYFCCNCGMNVNLDLRGMCSNCGSAAIVEETGEVEPVYLPEHPGNPFKGLFFGVLGGVLFLTALIWTWHILEQLRFFGGGQ
jgi:DNA-directed RNA polymerase subunit RPC12/RpoP